MKYAQIREFDVSNGVGIRTTLFVSGCHGLCDGCFNKDYWDFDFGTEWSKEIEDKFIEFGKKKIITGFSFLGGEPLMQNKDIMINLLKRIKSETHKSIWMWTGFELEKLTKSQKEIIKYVDILVDGRFIIDKKNLKLSFRGSSNQRILHNDGFGNWENKSEFYDNKI